MPSLLKPHHRVAVPAVALFVLAAVAACTSGSSSGSGHSPATAAGVAATTVRITGAGSTFDAPFFDLAFSHYQQAHPGVAVSYASVGSSVGITRFTAGKTNFGATDLPASAKDLAGASDGATVQVQVDLGAVDVAYNVPVLNGQPLKLTGPVLARIFLGQITYWDDPAITALNPGAELPRTYITVVHRSDGSGTTYIFSNYLSTVSPAWAAKVGTGRSLHWPTGYAGAGNAGVAKAISHIPYSIGYVERSYTTGTSLGAAAIQNRAGNYVTPTEAAIAADAAARPHITPTDFSIVNEPGSAAYPISGYSWILLAKHQTSQATGQAVVNLINWLTHSGQSDAASLGYVSLPAAIQQLATSMLSQVTGPNGASFIS
jgi:phosphate transport system substrate-binding protein